MEINEILNIVSTELGISEKEIQSKSRNREIATARQISHYLAKKYTNLSLIRIGEYIGMRTHGNVLYSINKVSNFEKFDKINFNKLAAVENKIISERQRIKELNKQHYSKPLSITDVMESVQFNADEILAFLNDCETLDEAKVFVNEHLR